MLGVFWFPAFGRLDYKREDPCNECMCAQTRPLFMLSSKRVLGKGDGTHVMMLAPRGKYSVLEAQRRVKPTTLHHTGQ